MVRYTCNSCDENCCKQSVNEHDCSYEHESDRVDIQDDDRKYYPNTSKNALPSAIKVQELFNILDDALYRAFNEYKPTYGEMFIALFQLQQKLYTLYMKDIARNSIELMRMEMVGMVGCDDRDSATGRLDIYT
ncbi:hypothetical protein HRbin04_00307 [archaeon HR04]|nr:hypothetical protein HRbin04_00307 [archaeon HR04]